MKVGNVSRNKKTHLVEREDGKSLCGKAAPTFWLVNMSSMLGIYGMRALPSAEVCKNCLKTAEKGSRRRKFFIYHKVWHWPNAHFKTFATSFAADCYEQDIILRTQDGRQLETFVRGTITKNSPPKRKGKKHDLS